MKKIIMSLFVLYSSTFVFAQSWSDNVYGDAPAAIHYGYWLTDNIGIDSMQRIISTFAEIYNNVEISYEDSNGNFFRPNGKFKYNGEDYWYIWDSTIFVIHKGNKDMHIYFSEPITNREDKYNNITPQIIFRAIENFLR